MSIFIRKELAKKNILCKLFKVEPKRNFIIELENCLADYENSLESLSVSNIKNLAHNYKINLEKDFIEERIKLFKRFLDLYFEKSFLTDQEYISIKHFASIICLPEKIFNQEYKNFATACYGKRIKEYLADEVITSSEKIALDDLKNKLRLSTETANEIYRNAVKEIMDGYTSNIFHSKRFSPQDEENMYLAANRLGLKLTFPPDIQRKLAKFRENWELDNGKLPILKSDIHLQDEEILHFKTQIKWMEERTYTQRVNYSGFTYSTKIIGDLRWRTGTYVPQRIQTTGLQEIDTGILYITNKRIIFIGQHENRNIINKKIINFHPYTDGILIEKDAGKSPFFAFDKDVEKAAIILANLLG